MTIMSLLNAQELARELNVSRATVYRLAREGQIPSVRIGNSIRFELDAVISGNRRKPAPAMDWRQALKQAME